ncbi:hypothetical protein H4R19_003496 [Coemansia spiralis]|nr:hypothetical protein H4R19_003496 [Coemansia spiralis]
MRIAVCIVFIAAALAGASPVLLRRDMAGAQGALVSIQSSGDDASLKANTATFYAQLQGVADPTEVAQSKKQVDDQIAANSRDHVPTQMTAAWISSVVSHFVTS